MFLLLALLASTARADRSSVVEARLQQMVLPEIDIRDASAEDFFMSIAETVREIDAEPGTGQATVNVFLNLTDEDKARHVSYNARGLSVHRIIADVCRICHFSFHIEDNVIWISSPERENRILESRTLVAGPPDPRGLIEKGPQEYFESRGVPFPAGASCSYARNLHKLFVVNTPANLKTMEALLAGDKDRAYEAPDFEGTGLKGGPWEGRNAAQLRGGPFKDRDITQLRGGNAERGTGTGRSGAPLERSQFARDMEVYQDAIRQRAAIGSKTELERRLDAMVIPELDLQQTSFRDAIALLEDLAREYDASSQGCRGFQAVFRTHPAEDATPITFRASRLSVMEAIRSLAGVTGVSFGAQGSQIVFYSKSPAGAVKRGE
jgi:hypothetical protein